MGGMVWDWRSWLASQREKMPARPRRPAKRLPRQPRKPERDFAFVLPRGDEKEQEPVLRRFVVRAMTRSEARARLKQQLGLDRLPAGASVRP